MKTNKKTNKRKIKQKSIEYVYKSRFHQFVDPVHGTKIFFENISNAVPIFNVSPNRNGYILTWLCLVKSDRTALIYTLYSLSLTKKKKKHKHTYTPPPINFYAKPKMRLDIINYGLTMLSIFKEQFFTTHNSFQLVFVSKEMMNNNKKLTDTM